MTGGFQIYVKEHSFMIKVFSAVLLTGCESCRAGRADLFGGYRGRRAGADWTEPCIAT
jgi:hypothetical protein